MNPDGEAEGVFDVIATEEHQAPAKPAEPVQKEKTAEAPKSESKPKQKVDEDEPRDGDRIDTQDFSRKDESEPDDGETDATEPSKETQKTEAVADDDWKTGLPPPPQTYQLIEPQVNDEGQITNMDAAQYQQYLVERAKSEMRSEMYTQVVENRALDVAEKILPELKTTPLVRQMVQNIRIASIVNGQVMDTVEAAKQVKELLSGSEAKGAQNAKASITIQKNAAVETKGATQTKAQPSKTDRLAKRLKAGDDEAFAELFDTWNQEGKL